MKSVLFIGFVFSSLFSFQSFSSPNCADSFSTSLDSFKTTLHDTKSTDDKFTFLRQNTENPITKIKQAVVKEAVGLATSENNTETIHKAADILVEMASDSSLPVREEIKSGILSIYKTISEKAAKDRSSEYGITFVLMAAFRKLGGSAATNFMKSFKNHPHPKPRRDAVFFTPDKNANEVIKVFLNDSNPLVQDQLVVKSVTAGNESALQELLKSSDIVVRKRAEAGLKILKSAEVQPDLEVFLDTRYSSWIRMFKDDSEILKGIADRLLVDNSSYEEIIFYFAEDLFLSDSHQFLHLDSEGVILHLVQRIGDMKKYYAEAMTLFFEGGGSWDGRSPPPGVRKLNPKIKQAVLEGMNRRPSTDLIELAGNRYFHEPFNGDEISQKTIVQMANLRGGVFQERIFRRYTNPYWRSVSEVDKMIVEGLKQVKASNWNDAYQSALMNLIQKYKNDYSSTIAEELTALKNHK